MRHPIFSLSFAFLFGLFGAFLRGLTLTSAWNPFDAVLDTRQPYTWLLLGLVLCFLVLTLLFTRRANRQGGARLQPRRVLWFSLSLDYLAVACLLASCVFECLNPDGVAVDVMIFIGLSVLFSVLLIASTRSLFQAARRTQPLGRLYPLLVALQMLWGVYWFYLTFVRFLPDPSFAFFAVEFFAVMFFVLCLSKNADIHFRMGRMRQVLVYALFCLFFSVIVLGGALYSFAVTGSFFTSGLGLAEALRLLFAMLHVIVIVFSLHGQTIGVVKLSA